MRRTGKKSLVTGILAMSLILGGTGYSYWTDSLNVTTKATTGTFGVKFVDSALHAQYDDEKQGWSIVDGIDDEKIGSKYFVKADFFKRDQGDYNKIARDGSIGDYQKRAAGYHNVKIDEKKIGLVDPQAISKDVGDYKVKNTNGSNKIEINLENMYPGYAQAFRSDILNMGDIAAKLSDIKFRLHEDYTPNQKVYDMLGIALYMRSERYEKGEEFPKQDVLKLAAAGFKSDQVFTVGGVEFVRLSAFLKDKELRNILQNNTILSNPVDSRMDMYLGIAMDPDAAGKYTTGTAQEYINLNTEEDVKKAKEKDKATQGKSAQLEIEMIWSQFNEGVKVNDPNILEKQNNN